MSTLLLMTNADAAKTLSLVAWVVTFFIVLNIGVFIYTIVRNAIAKKKNPESGSHPAVNHALLEASEENTPGVFAKIKEHKSKWSLNLTDISNPERSFSASGKSEYMVGRKAQNDICIPDDGYVSGVHCKFEKEGDTVYVTDMESSNGTKVNGNKIKEKTPLAANDIVRIGKVEYKVTT